MAVARVTNPLQVGFPGQNAPLTADPNSQPQSPWWQFLRALWLRTGGLLGIDASAVADDVATLDTLQVFSDAPPPTPIPPLPLAITPGASPFSYQAPWNGFVLVTGGTVSAVALSRDHTTFFAFPTAGAVPVFKGDVVKVTYTGAPTMTMVAL